MEKEIWKDIPGYEGFYQASNLGRVKSVTRIITDKHGILRKLYGTILHQYIGTNKYYQVNLSVNGKMKTEKVHKLIGLAFLPKENPTYEINHKDENKLNNKANNLEWCSRSYNMLYNDNFKKLYKKVYKMSLENKFLQSYESLKDAANKNNCEKSGISACCNGKIKTYKGYIWKYEKEKNIG